MRTIVAVLIATLSGLAAMPLIFSDMPGVPVLSRVVILAAIFILGGLLVGLIARHRWPLAAICAWSPLLMGLCGLLGQLGTGSTLPHWLEIVGFLLGPPLASLFGGFLGSRLRLRAKRGSRSEGPRPDV